MFHQLGSTINGHFKPISFAFHSNKSIFGERIKDFEHTVMLTVMIIVLSYDYFIMRALIGPTSPGSTLNDINFKIYNSDFKVNNP